VGRLPATPSLADLDPHGVSLGVSDELNAQPYIPHLHIFSPLPTQWLSAALELVNQFG